VASVAVLQARTTSTRLPAKALLPIAGIPMAVLAAKRAANTGRTVVVATSSDPSDDALAALIESHGLRCFRGSLENTLERFVEALASYDDATLVFRLTADNVFPDGQLLDEMEEEFRNRGLDYLSSTGVESGLPYGTSAELTLLRHLRAADCATTDKYDREHVTPYAIRRFGRQVFQKYTGLRKGHYRCTVDNLDDYLRIQKVFSGIEAPISVPALSLIDRLAALDDAPLSAQPAARLVLGGAQLGLDYGIANTAGKPAPGESRALIKTAIANGVCYIDTARAYGNSEEVIGKVLSHGWADRARVITKLDPLTDCPATAEEASVAAFVNASVYRSCAALRRDSLDVLLLHRAEHLDAWNHGVWRRLLELKRAGVMVALGVSVQTPAELTRAVREPDVTHIQLPFNVLDGRWSDSIRLLQQVRIERGITVHVRSALLQGLLPSVDPGLWTKANAAEPQRIIDWLRALVSEYRREDVADLCLAYVRSQTWLDGIVVGMESLAQLAQNIRYFSTPPLQSDDLRRIDLSRPSLADETLNPALWQRS